MYSKRFAVLFVCTAFIFLGTKAYASTAESAAYAYLHERHIVRGEHHPDALLTRVEGLAAVLRSREKFAPQIVWFTENLPESPLFSDIDQSAWYAAYIEVGFLEGVVSGYSDGSFRPSDPLRGSEAVAMLERAYGKEVETSVTQGILTRGEFFALLSEMHSGRTLIAVEEIEEVEEVNEVVEIEETGPTITEEPIEISPVPFGDTEPFTIDLPEPAEPEQITEEGSPLEFASEKPFAISIPSLGINDVSLLHPEDPFSQDGILAVLKQGLGHLFVYPGDGGKIMIYGHSSAYPWDFSEYARIFRRINQLKDGERIYVTYEGNMYVYAVSSHQVVAASDSTPFSDDGSEELILYTCWPPDSIKERYLVHAKPVKTVALR